MKKSAKAIFFSLSFVLASCGGNADAPAGGVVPTPSGGSSAVDSETAFNALSGSLDASSQENNIRLESRDSKVHLSAKASTSGGEYSPVNMTLDPTYFDVRLGNLQATDVNDLCASIVTKDGDLSSAVSIEVPGYSTPKVNCAPTIYLQQGVAYLDFTSAGALTLAINSVYKQSKGKNLLDGSRNKITLNTHDWGNDLLNGIQDEMPFANHLTSLKSDFVNELKNQQEASPNNFAFTVDASSIYTLSYSATSKEDFRKILETVDVPLGRLDEIREDLLEEGGADFVVNRFVLQLQYGASGILGFSYDASLDFAEPEDPEEAYLVGENSFSGHVSVTYGEQAKPLSVQESHVKYYKEIELPEKK